MSKLYAGHNEITVASEIIDELYQKGEVEVPDKRHTIYPNMFVTLKNGSQSAITRMKNSVLHLVNTKVKAAGVVPRNREQIMALDLLLDTTVPIVFLTGTAGSGKTLLTNAAAIEAVEKKEQESILITKSMSFVGKQGLGYLPGNLDEKFQPYNQGFFSNLELLLKNQDAVDSFLDMYRVEFLPLQLARGASWHHRWISIDESQNLDCGELATLGTRVAEGSKVVIFGDLKQRDEKLAIEKTGMYKFINSAKSKESALVGVVELTRCERSPSAALFASVFEV